MAADAGRKDGDGQVRDGKFQNAFERVRMSLIEGNQDLLSWDYKQWQAACREQGFNLLNSSGFSKAQREAADLVDRNRGSWDEFWDYKATKEKERQVGRDSVVPQVWAQLDQLANRAFEGADSDPKGIQARQMLSYIVMSNGKDLPVKEKAQAVDKAVDALARIAAGNGPGRGDMVWVLRSLLSEKPDLSAANKEKLMESMAKLADPDKGKISKESAANIALLALQQESRIMPLPGQAGYDQSIKYQKKTLDLLEQYANRDLAKLIKQIAKSHPDASVRARAQQVSESIEKKVPATSAK